MTIIDSAEFSTKLNQVWHKFEIYLDSGYAETENQIFPINPNAIVNLKIEETLADWVTKGTLSFFYNPETDNVYNKKTGNTNDATTGVSIEGKPFFTFRNDGYDRLRIRIIPDTEKINSNINSQTNTSNLNITNKNHWSLSYLFSIYNVEDVDLPPGAQNQASASIKCLKLYFWDTWYQRMISRNLEYSTALSNQANIKQDIQENITNNYGLLKTGRAMKEIIDICLSQSETQESYTTSAKVDNLLGGPQSATADIGEEWEEGKTKIFYTAPTQTTAYDSLMYIYDKHISEVTNSNAYDFCLLSKERSKSDTDIGYLTLKSVASYFEKAGKEIDAPGDYQFEHFFLQAYGEKERATKTLRAPFSETKSDKKDLKTSKYSMITNYRFVDIASLTNTVNFANTPVYSFDFKNRTFNVEFQNNNVKTAREFMNKKYIDQLYKSGSGDKLFLINLNKDKQTNKIVQPVFSPYGDDSIIRQSSGLQKLLYVGLFHNAAINFRALGLSFRRPGSFIAIDKTDGVESGDFEDKFYGQWFVINVKHVFESEMYYNDITAVKIHRYTAPKTDFPGTY